MNRAPMLNTLNAPQWAEVGMTWEHGTRPLSAVSIFAGSGAALGWLPTRLDTLNQRAHFLAFAKSAHGKVRHSVRWKSTRRIRKTRYLRSSVGSVHIAAKWLAPELAYRRYVAHLAGLDRSKAYKHAKCRSEILWQLSKKFGIEHLDYYQCEQVFQNVIKQLDDGEERLYFPEVARYNRSGNIPAYLLSKCEILHICRLSFKHFDAALNNYHKTLLVFGVILWRLNQAALRAKAAPRVYKRNRARAPRPLYTRTIPPSAPLAPPVI